MHIQLTLFNASQKAVILSEALRTLSQSEALWREVEEPVLSLPKGPQRSDPTYAVRTLSATDIRTWRTTV